MPFILSVSRQRVLSILIAFFLFYTPFSLAEYTDISAENGAIRLHYSNEVASSCDVIVLGVGTAMGADAYDRLSSALNGYGYLVAILDHNPGNIVKTDSERYLALASELKSTAQTWLNGTGCESVDHWVMGGHSAGGQAAQNAIAQNRWLADAIFSVDPYDASVTEEVFIPALYWGFSFTSCFVTREDAAEEAYRRSNDKRAFFQVQEQFSWGPCGYAPEYFHCSFCDNGCPGCTNCRRTPAHFFDDVAASVNKFINAAFYSDWSKAALTINAETPIELYVDQEMP
ncbi:alpha/beta hydrolase [Marinibactrum halimedae]|uniref:Alpha/beta hydrolase n=1 Tax=Marinibactrum halimedae TaxID=1444977 RepID=A0AA37T1X3_9GAMM|nr:alpha/beta hydrolase [Marinibactrum halimedae]MCD9459126.1 alpha/beta hydrolase [Marinibactrum halimedae]GLS24728.1 hypothetical protein GCM10007877_04420 [Marinibactrum halimedae]